MPARKSQLLIICLLFFSTVFSQKYDNKNVSEVKTTWEETTFSSLNTISENIANINSFSYLESILKDEKLSQILADEEMVTIFAPLDTSFTKLPKETREALLLNTGKIRNIVKFLSVPGRLDRSSIYRAIRHNGGTTHFTTLTGEKLGAKMRDRDIVLFDSENNITVLKATDFYHKNGFFHIVEGLVYPSSEGEN